MWVDFLNGAIAALAGSLCALIIALGVALAVGRAAVGSVARSFAARLLADRYDANLFELASATRRVSPQVVVETALRADSGKVIYRPLGSPHRFLHFDGLMFRPAQLARLPTPDEQPVDLSVTIGPQAARPLRLDIPILITGMGYGVALSERAKIALARGADLAGTASNTGQGVMLPEERRATRRLIMQYARADWGRDEAALRQADAVEIALGHGAWAGAGGPVSPEPLDRQAAERLGLGPDGVAQMHARLREMDRPRDLRRVVDRLRALTGGVPVGVKIAPGEDLELDLEIALEAGIDFVTVDGAQGATHGGPPILQDDFGLPTVHLLPRAARFLERSGLRGRVSLIASGGLWAPEDFLKAIALGADAVAVGTIALFALAHGQLTRADPWEPPTQLVLAVGKFKDRLDVDLAARSVANLLRACATELEIGVRALGKDRLRDVDGADLVALDSPTGDATGVPLARRAD